VTGEEDPMAYYRKKTLGDWKAHFTHEHGSCFTAKYNDLLVTFSYEKNADW